MTVKKSQGNNFMVRGQHNMRNCIKSPSLSKGENHVLLKGLWLVAISGVLHSESTSGIPLTQYPTQGPSDLKRKQYRVLQKHCRLQHSPSDLQFSCSSWGVAGKTFYCPRPLHKEETQPAPNSSMCSYAKQRNQR